MKAGLIRSQEITRLSNFAQAADLELGCSLTREFLIESLVEGDALEIDGVIAEGEPVTFGITEQIPSKAPPFFIEGYLCPAAHLGTEPGELLRLSDLSITPIVFTTPCFTLDHPIN